MSTAVEAPIGTRKRRGLAIGTDRAMHWLARHWMVAFAVLAGLYAGLPWLAPVLMRLGWTAGGQVIYVVYSTQCHQLPQRSFFLFGRQPMYSLAQIQAVTGPTDNSLVLRAFAGNAEMGWKVAWSDRMVSMYTGILAFGLLYIPVRKRLPRLPWWGLALFTFPMLVDGLSHFLSDLAGLGQGFRDSNTWLAALTGSALPATFYAGDALGSFNSWMRLTTGALFALGVVWLAFPHVEQMLADSAARIEEKLKRRY